MGTHHRRRGIRAGTAVAVAVLLASTLVAVGSAPAGAAPKPGGQVRFGLEAESTGGFCLPQAQLAISGIQVVSAIYDTLTAPNTKGKYVPNLAESVTPNATFNEWTIKVRPNVQFHDGSPLNADAVKQNIDAWRTGRLFAFIYGNIASVDKVDDLTVKVTAKTPWAAFPAYLYLVGRAGIAAPAQLANPATCGTNLIGTGPFKLNSPGDWKVNESLTAVKNPSYWKKDAKGNQLPYLDRITFVPVVDTPSRDNQLAGGQLDLMHTSAASSIDANARASGIYEVTEPPGNRDVRYYMMNTAKAPFDNADARLALAYALDVKAINTIRNKGMFDLANSVIDSKAQGYVKNPGQVKYNLKKAQDLVAKVKQQTGSFDVAFLTTNDSEDLAEAQLLQEQAAKAGMNATISPVVDQSALINDALAGKFSVLLWRNFHSDPEFNDSATYVWWSPSPVNFGRVNDVSVLNALNAGRVATDTATADTAYQDFNKALATGNYVVPGWFVPWTIAARNNVKGIAGAPLPDGSKPRFMYGRIPVDGLYLTK